MHSIYEISLLYLEIPAKSFVHFTLPRHVTYFSALVTFDTSSVLSYVNGRGTFASHVAVTLAFEASAFRWTITCDVTKSLASVTLLTPAAATATHGCHGAVPSAAAKSTTKPSTATASSTHHAYAIRAISGDVPVFFTVVTIFDVAIFTRFGWFRAFARDVAVIPAVVANCAVWAVPGNVTLLVALVA